MSTQGTEPNTARKERFALLRADVAAFSEEMHLHSTRPSDSRGAWLSFSLGATAALAVFAVASWCNV